MEKIKYSAEQLRNIQSELRKQQLDDEIKEVNKKFEYALNNNKNYIDVESLSNEAREILINLGFTIFDGNQFDSYLTINW